MNHSHPGQGSRRSIGPSRGKARTDNTHERHYPVDLTLGEIDAGEPVERVLRRRLRADPAHVQKLLRQGRVTLIDDTGERVMGRGDALPGTRRPDAPPPGDADDLDSNQSEVLSSSSESSTEARRADADGYGPDGKHLLDGAVLRVGVAPPRPAPQKNTKIRLTVLDEREDWAAINKPPGLSMHPGPGHGSDTVLNALVARWPELIALGPERGYGMVHRLDRETSGVLIIAKTARGYDHLVQSFAARRVEKRYVALVDERQTQATDVVVRSPVSDREAETFFRVLGREGPIALVEARPTTGRTHQIRIHLAELGTPVLADPRYGTGLDDLTATLYLKRLGLHAERASFPDPAVALAAPTDTDTEADSAPTTFARIEVIRDWPRDLRHAWRRAARINPSS